MRGEGNQAGRRGDSQTEVVLKWSVKYEGKSWGPRQDSWHCFQQTLKRKEKPWKSNERPHSLAKWEVQQPQQKEDLNWGRAQCEERQNTRPLKAHIRSEEAAVRRNKKAEDVFLSLTLIGCNFVHMQRR